eukprot:scaffold35894_cov250-Skeletonema_dohrnii-CCMP3373.AAC.2
MIDTKKRAGRRRHSMRLVECCHDEREEFVDINKRFIARVKEANDSLETRTKIIKQQHES